MESDVQPSGSDRRTSTTTARQRSRYEDLPEKILTGCRNGHVESQEWLYKRFYGYAMSAALAYSPTRDDALEVVNDSFMKVFEHIDRFESGDRFKPWLRRIVINTAIDQSRKMKRFNQHSDLDTDQLQELSPVSVEAQMNEKQILKLLNDLPDLLRFVFNMYELEGYSHREIADKLSIAESSSRTYLTRAKNRLRTLYEERFNESR